MRKYNIIKNKKNKIKINSLPEGSKAIAVWFNSIERYKSKFSYGQKIIYSVLKIIEIIKWGNNIFKGNFFASKQWIFRKLNGETKENPKLTNTEWSHFFNYSRWGNNVAKLPVKELKKIKEILLESFKTAERAFTWLEKNNLIEKVDKNPNLETYKLVKRKRLVWIVKKAYLNFKTDMKNSFRVWSNFVKNFGNSFKTNEASLQDSPPAIYNNHLVNLDDQEWDKYIKENWESWKLFYEEDKEE